MSGIVGILSLSPKAVGTSILATMMTSLRHRGPSGSSHWVDDTVGLGQLNCSTGLEPPSASLLSQFGSQLVGVADARLDNRSELALALHIQADSAQTLSDADLICRCYAKWGRTCTQRLKGDFSFAIWDSINSCLFCARDRLGVRPFYFYYCSEKWFLFASEMKALLATNIVPARINPQRIGQYLLSDLADKQITFYRDISRLPPAHWLSLRAGHLGLERYWSLDSIREVGSRSDDCLEEEFRDRLVRSVGLRTKNTKRLGAMLSGGLDSSSIVGAASCLQAPTDPRKLETISLIFDDLADCDESKYIGAVRRKFQTQPYFIRGDQLDPFMGCGVDFWFQDEPFYTPNLFLHQAMYKLARSAGMDVLLDGFDGDVVVSHGLGYLLETLRDLRFANFFHELRALAKKWDCSAFSLVRHHILGRVTPRGVKNSLRRLRAITGKNSLASGILSPKFAKLLARTAADQSVTVVADGVQYTAQAAHVSDLEHGAIPLALEVANRASAAYGVEPRYPFFDSDFVEFCVGIPANQKLRDGWTRSILRRAMSVVLPAEVCWRRSKSDLSLNFARSMSTYGQQTIERMLARDDTPVWEFADIEVVRGSYRGLQRFSGTRDALLVWKAITLGVWLERVLGI